jgi:proteasome lid subunit RPN8/RPN11
MNRNGGTTSLKAWGSPEDSKVVIYIDKQAYDDINRHGAANPEREVVGILLGNVSEETSGKYRVDVVGTVKSGSAPGDKTQAQFTDEVWLQLVESAKRDYPNQKVVGWYHTHPGFGAFMSDDDVNSHRLAFSHPWHIAAVCDPIKNELCFFGWDDSEIKAIKGFYTYEVPAKEPKLLPSPQSKPPLKTKTPAFLIPVLVLFVVLFTIIGLVFTVWLPGGQNKTSQPPFKGFPAAVVSVRNADREEVYSYYFTQNNSEVWRYTLNKDEPWDKEMSLPITLKEIASQPTVAKQGNSGITIGTLELQAEDEKGELWLLSADILTDGRLAEWQQTEKTAMSPDTSAPLSVSPPYLFFGTTRDAIPLQLSFTDNENLSWQIVSKPAGINVDNESGVSNATIDVTVQRSELSLGDHLDKIIISYDGDKMTKEVPTFITVTSATVPAQNVSGFRIISIKDESDDGRISRGGEKVLVVVQNTGQISGEVEVSINSSEIFAILESPEAKELKPGEESTFAFLLKPTTMRSGVSEILVFKAENLTSNAAEYDEESERFSAP